MRGSVIGPLNVNPQGRFLTGILGDTSGYGTAMQIQAGTAVSVSGLFTWVHYAPSADNDPRLVVILVNGFPGSKMGFTPVFPGSAGQAAGTIGQVCEMYVPLPGDEMNINVKGQQGTGSANAFTVGERLGIDHTSGKFIQQSTSANRAAFDCLEHIDEVADIDTLVWAMRCSNL